MEKKIWFFTKSKEGRNLLHFKRDILLVLSQGSIKFSTLLAPKNFPQSGWNNVWADIFIQAFGIYDGTKNFMIKHLKRLFSETKNPSLTDLYNQIENTKYPLISRYARYQESAQNRLGGLLSSPISNAIDCRDISIELFSNYNVIFEIQYLAAEQQVFIVNILLSWLYYFKLYNEIEVTHFVGIDDSTLVFDQSFEHRPDRGLPIISHLLSTVRKSKIIIICCSQIPHHLGSSIHSNSFTKVMFSLGDGRDIECMVKSMGIIDPEQREYCYQLNPQEMIIKYSARYQEPFLASVPFTTFPEEQPSDEEIKTNNRRILPFLTEETIETEQVIIQANEEKEEKKEADKKETIASDLRQFLTEVYNHPLNSITQHYSNLNMSAGKGHRIRQKLLKLNLLETVLINRGEGRGSLSKYLTITKQGYNEINLSPLKWSKGSGFEHFFWQNIIASHLKKSENRKVTIEANLKDKFIDILVEQLKDDKQIKLAIEVSITTTQEDEKSNIIKDVEAGVDFVIIACKKDKITEINKMIASLDIQYREKTYSCLLPELLKTNDLLSIVKFEKSI